MDVNIFDQITKRFAARRLSRRQIMTRSGATLAVAGLGISGRRVQAQGTPATANGDMAANNATFFVQTAASGSFVPKPRAATAGTPDAAAHGAYLLTLEGHSGATIAFSDRPRRNFGAVATSQFFTSMGFTPANPPNAALVAGASQRAQDVLLVELLNPAFDAGSKTLTYEANVLQGYRGEELKPLADQQQDQQFAAQFDSASLFIDDCPDYNYCCFLPGQYPDGCPTGSGIHVGTCWNWKTWTCDLCEPNRDYGAVCDQAYAACNGQCEAHYNGGVCFC